MKRRRKKQKAVTNLWPFVTKELILIPQLAITHMLLDH